VKYRKKPVVIDAFHWLNEDPPEWFRDATKVGRVNLVGPGGTCHIKTLEGIMKANAGDYIIQGVKGEIYPCKPDIFEMTYEKVEETP